MNEKWIHDDLMAHGNVQALVARIEAAIEASKPGPDWTGTREQHDATINAVALMASQLGRVLKVTFGDDFNWGAFDKRVFFTGKWS